MMDVAIGTPTSKDALEEFEAQATTLTIGSVAVESAKATMGRDADDSPAVFLRLILSDPNGETWTSTDMFQLHRELIDVADRLQLHLPLYVRFDPTSDDPSAEDDELPLPPE